MSYDIKIQGKVYSFDTLSEYKSVKDMSSSERAAYVANMSGEDEMQALPHYPCRNQITLRKSSKRLNFKTMPL